MLGALRASRPMPSPIPALLVAGAWPELLAGAALWALGLYLPISRGLSGLEQALAGGGLPPAGQQLLLVASGLVLALLAGLVADLAVALALGPGWGTSLGVIVAGWGLFWSLASRTDD